MTGIFWISAGRFLDFLAVPDICLEIMDFTRDFEVNPYILRGGQDDTQDYVVSARKFSIPLNNFLRKTA